MARRDFDFTIEEWSPDGERLIDTLAAANHIAVAGAAWLEAISTRPKAVVRLRKGALIMREKRPDGPPRWLNTARQG